MILDRVWICSGNCLGTEFPSTLVLMSNIVSVSARGSTWHIQENEWNLMQFRFSLRNIDRKRNGTSFELLVESGFLRPWQRFGLHIDSISSYQTIKSLRESVVTSVFLSHILANPLTFRSLTFLLILTFKPCLILLSRKWPLFHLYDFCLFKHFKSVAS